MIHITPTTDDIVDGDAEAQRLASCREIAERVYTAGLGDHYAVIERMTRPEIRSAIAVEWGRLIVEGVARGIRSGKLPRFCSSLTFDRMEEEVGC